ncbi:unnamed protein product [Brassicogethes aeneus]|uniref:Uncharacterized protein n=1 Tax=Brassicogethes aeneus TaxID=1431903 RepID=A0A9P0AYS6_BRAAE|nr:unnamed protein product [Brassicogethes aeneus]
MSPKPFLATITEVMRSGMEVPAAKNVSPITSGGMRTVSPTMLAHHTIRYEYAAIHMIDPRNVIGKNFLPTIVKTIRLSRHNILCYKARWSTTLLLNQCVPQPNIYKSVHRETRIDVMASTIP